MLVRVSPFLRPSPLPSTVSTKSKCTSSQAIKFPQLQTFGCVEGFCIILAVARDASSPSSLRRSRPTGHRVSLHASLTHSFPCGFSSPTPLTRDSNLSLPPLPWQRYKLPTYGLTRFSLFNLVLRAFIAPISPIIHSSIRNRNFTIRNPFSLFGPTSHSSNWKRNFGGSTPPLRLLAFSQSQRHLPLRRISKNSPSQWDEKQLVAALERASLLDLQKLLKVQPIKAPVNDASQLGTTASARRGRFMPPAEAVANIRLDVSYVQMAEKDQEKSTRPPIPSNPSLSCLSLSFFSRLACVFRIEMMKLTSL